MDRITDIIFWIFIIWICGVAIIGLVSWVYLTVDSIKRTVKYRNGGIPYHEDRIWGFMAAEFASIMLAALFWPIVIPKFFVYLYKKYKEAKKKNLEGKENI